MAKMVEVDEEQLQRDANLRSTLAKIMGHPEGRLLAERAYKLVDPKAPTPHLDQAASVNAPIEEVKKTINEFIAGETKRRADDESQRKLDTLNANIESGLSSLRRQGWTEEGITGVRKVMEDKGILDPAVAAAYFEKEHPPATPMTPGGSGAWNFLEMSEDTDADLKKLIETKGESMPLLDKMAHDALNEVRGQQRR